MKASDYNVIREREGEGESTPHLHKGYGDDIGQEAHYGRELSSSWRVRSPVQMEAQVFHNISDRYHTELSLWYQ